MRQYEKDLVSEIRRKQYIKNVDGINILMKPVPDDNRENVMDPRILEIAMKKKAMFSNQAKTGYSLSKERYRPDKIAYDLTEREIEVEERLIDINNDHKIDIYIYRCPEDNGKLPVVVYLHGGGFTAGDMRLFAQQMKLIADLANAVVVFPEYRLAPECPFPGPIDDAFGTVQWVYDHADELGIDVNRFMVAGDSAGGALTNACILKDEKHIIKKAFEIYPGADSIDYKKQTKYEWSYDQYPIIEEQKEFAYSRIDRIKNACGISEGDSLYIQGKTTFDNPLVSVACASDEQLVKFPPVVIAAADYDYLRVGSDYLVKRLTELNKDVTSIRYCGSDHGFFDLLGVVVQAEELAMTIADEVKKM